MTEPGHRCRRLREARREGPWREAGLLREREIVRAMVCAECGCERPSRFRKVVAVEREARPGADGEARVAAGADTAIRRLAGRLERLFRSRASLRAGPLLRRLGGVRTEADLERLAACAPIRLVYRPRGGSLHLQAVQLLDAAALAEFARPGAAAWRAAALAEARRATAALTHPEARAIADLLAAPTADALDERVVRALAALARLVEAGEARPARLFSAEALGYSKALLGVRSRLERLVGPLERLGVRDAGAVVLLGGEGLLRLPGGDVNVGRFRYVGLAADDVLRLSDLTLPAGGLLVVENLTPFEACLALPAARHARLVLWSGGFPGRAVTSLIRAAAARGAPIRLWCDADLGGIRIARLVHAAAPGRVTPVLMDPATVRDAPVACPLTREQRARIARDLTAQPDALLVDTLRAILERDAWVEQETLVDRLGAALG